MSDTEKIRLELETIRFDQIPAIQQNLRALGEEFVGVTLAFGRGELTLEEYDAETRRIGTSTSNLTRALKDLESAQSRVEAAGRGAASATAGMGDSSNKARQGFVDLSRAAQDFAQGGFPAIINNLEGIGRALPAILGNPLAMLTSLPGLMTAVGVAGLVVYQNWDKVKKAFMDTFPLDTTGNRLHALQGELEATKKKLSEIEEQESVTKETQEEYNAALERQATLEKKITDEQQRRKNLEGLKELKEPTEAEDTKQRQEELKDSFGSQEEQALLVKDLAESFRMGAVKELDQLNAQIESYEGRFLTREQEAERDRLVDRRDQIKTQAQDTPEAYSINAKYAKDLIGKAIMEGDLDAFRTIQGQMRSLPSWFEDRHRAAIEVASPEQHKLDLDTENDLERVKRLGERQREREKARRKEAEDFEKLEREEMERAHAPMRLREEADKAGKATNREAEQHARTEAEGRREQDAKDLEKGLGKEFIARAGEAMRRVEQLRGDERDRARMGLSDQIQRQAMQQLMAGGFDAGRAAVLANQAGAFVRQALREKGEQARALRPARAPKPPRRVGLKAPVVPRGSAAQRARAGEQSDRQRSLIAAEGERERQRAAQQRLNVEKARQWDRARQEAGAKARGELMRRNATPDRGGPAAAGALGKATTAAASSHETTGTLLEAVKLNTQTLARVLEGNRSQNQAAKQLLAAAQKLSQPLPRMRT